MDELRRYLATVKPGRVHDVDGLRGILTGCWDQFSGSDATRMASWKIAREDGFIDVEWQPPRLTFTIIRHGAAVVGGSKRGERQLWTLDVDAMRASCSNIGYKLLTPNQPKLDTTTLAAELAPLVLSRARDPRLTINADGTVDVNIGELIPDVGPKQTVQGRRKRFRLALCAMLAGHSWTPIRGGRTWRFAPPKS